MFDKRMWALLLLVFWRCWIQFEEHVCNWCHDLLTMAYLLENIAILSAKAAVFRCFLISISKNEALKKLNNSVT